MATSTFAQLLSSVQVQRCFTSTQTIRTVRDREPRMATLTFIQYCFTATQTIRDRGAQDGHLDSHTS